MKKNNKLEVSIIMGSNSDWNIMQNASQTLDEFKLGYEVKIISAHRTPDRLYTYAKGLSKKKISIVIAGAGGAAHLPGMISSMTTIPVLGVPIESKFLNGLDSLLSIVQMPFGVPTATFAVGKAGAKNAALFAVSILATSNKSLDLKIKSWRKIQTKNVAIKPS